MERHLDIEKTIRNYLPQIVHMSLATHTDGKPWVCEVHFATDNELNIYLVHLWSPGTVRKSPRTRMWREIS